jgi:hypothetical protein
VSGAGADITTRQSGELPVASGALRSANRREARARRRGARSGREVRARGFLHIRAPGRARLCDLPPVARQIARGRACTHAARAFCRYTGGKLHERPDQAQRSCSFPRCGPERAAPGHAASAPCHTQAELLAQAVPGQMDSSVGCSHSVRNSLRATWRLLTLLPGSCEGHRGTSAVKLLAALRDATLRDIPRHSGAACQRQGTMSRRWCHNGVEQNVTGLPRAERPRGTPRGSGGFGSRARVASAYV